MPDRRGPRVVRTRHADLNVPDPVRGHAGLVPEPCDHLDESGLGFGLDEVDAGLEPRPYGAGQIAERRRTDGAPLVPVSRTDTAAAYAASAFAA
jgi:hypothetical protein